MQPLTTRIRQLAPILGLGALLALQPASASAGLVGSTVHARFYGLDPFSIDDDAGTFTIAEGTSFTFTDPFYGIGTFMQVTFSDTKITLTNLIPGLYPNYTAANFEFLTGPALTSVTLGASSSPLFSTGSILTSTGKFINVGLSNTCALCSGLTTTSHGESIVLDVTTAVPKPASIALFSAGLLALAWGRRKAG